MSMPVMHENMHEGTKQDQQIWQIGNRHRDMCLMLSPKKISSDYDKDHEDDFVFP
jgi:hypothetical protein